MIGNDKSKIASSNTGTLWQHPYVDVFKHFKISPTADWKQNKKQGDVSEIFAKEIGRKAMNISGSISANNFVQIPHPNTIIKSLNLTGRFFYIEAKSPHSGTPFTIHFDIGMAEKSHNVRLSLSNLFKHFNTSNGFAVQVPLELQTERWTVVALDLVEIIKKSQLFPSTYKLDGAHSLKSVTLCANLQVRGVYTSDNLYEYVNLPSDLRFKFAFDINRWEEFFDWINLPEDINKDKENSPLKSIQSRQSQLKGQRDEKSLERQREEERKRMQQEIDDLLQRQKQVEKPKEETEAKYTKKSRIGNLPEIQNLATPNESSIVQAQPSGYIISQERQKKSQALVLQGLQNKASDYVSGSYIGVDLKRSPKLNQDPILELKHIIGYSPDKCLNLKWSRYSPSENIVIFTSGGNLIAMDVYQNSQKRFFFGHSAPICCFDINANGTLIASAQEGKNSIIRIWEYFSGRCISMVTMPVNQLKCLSFSHDGKYLATVGKDQHNREMVIVWDISKVQKGDKPEIVAKQTSDFNIIQLKFSPIDSTRMASCGKENIRFWRIKENTGSIRGSAVVLNHHARNSVFTSLDFEFGARSVDPKENESLKRLFVGSKHGMVFQINYHTESLEATYQTNDGAIYSIAVNEAFCVTGSEDTYLRVWPLDFSEFFMEAKHEGTVCAVDISSDGLKVVCGTTYGSLGILDKSNQKYRTLLRSHTDQILGMDFHLAKRNVITVSKDKTIRLWDVENFDQVYEFSSPIDQALSVAAHPTLPLFSCGFESGVMRVFDIERTCVADEFSQFNKPLVKLAYSPQGDLLVTCCQDGGVAIHNARRQHLPIKMMHLEFPPEFVHVAFSLNTSQGGSGNLFDENLENEGGTIEGGSQRFAIMGEYGNNVNIYDTNSFIVKHQIQANALLRVFQFANNNREIVLATTDCKVKVYSLAKFEGIFLREISTVHRGNVVSLSISNNSGYMLTGGEDNMVKVWDYEATKTVPYFFQSFIGHTYGVKNLMFNPVDNGIVLSAGEKDGIYVWGFYGDTQTQFYHNTAGVTQEGESLQKQPSQGRIQSQSTVLEKMRTLRKESKLSLVPEDTFILPQFKQLSQIEQQDYTESVIDQTGASAEFDPTNAEYLKTKRDRQLTYNHYSGTFKQYDIEQEPVFLMEESKSGEDGQSKTISANVINGYDGFGGVHSNVVWHSTEGWTAYTLFNKVIFENTKTRDQTILNDSSTQLSTLAISPDKAFIAAAEGSSNKQGNSYIFIYTTADKKLQQKLTFHQKGVQSLAFSNCSKYLISVGVQGENTLAVWDIAQGLVIKSALVRHYSTNAVRVDPYIEDGFLMFATVGNRGAFSFWRLDIENQQLQTYDVDPPSDYQDSNFTNLAYTPFLPAPINTYLILLTASDGSMTAYDQKNNVFVENGAKKWCISGEIGEINVTNQSVVLGSSTGTLAKYFINQAQVFPQDSKSFVILKTDGPIVSVSMDSLNNEGIIGTSLGTLFYANFEEKLILKLSQRATIRSQDEISILKINHQNPTLFLSSSGSQSSQAKLWTTSSLDLVTKFTQVKSPVTFILPTLPNSKFSLIGHQNGQIKVVSIDTLKVEGVFEVPQLSQDETLSSAVYNPNGVNFAIGTSFGNLYIGSLKDDNQGKPKLLIGRLDGISKQTQGQSVTSLQFSSFDPVGSFSVAFDNGHIKTWQSSVKNEQFLKLLEMQQQQVNAQLGSQFDICESGYQQYDLIDIFDIFENPHGLDELSEQDKQQLKILYSGKKYKQFEVRFAPGQTSADLYFTYVSALQYIYVRNYVARTIVKRVSLMYFPTCFQLVDYTSLLLNDEANSSPQGGESVLAVVGTKEGKVLVVKISSQETKKVLESKGGLSYGSITAIDVSPQAEKIVASNQSGEIFTLDLVDNL